MRTLSIAMIVASIVAAGACSSSKDEAPADATVDEPDASGPGQLCGGLAGAQCAATAYCDYPDHTCGSSDASGECMDRPSLCSDLIDPVCGCDGMVYQNECKANLAGVDPSITAECTAPPDRIRCGHRFCSAGDACRADYTCGTAP